MTRYGSIYVITNTVANAIKQKGRVAGKYTLEKVA